MRTKQNIKPLLCREFGKNSISLFIFFISINFCVIAQDEFNAVNIENLKQDELEAFKELTAEKVNEFETYLSTIASKDRPKEDKALATKQALKLFTPQASIQISYKKDGKITRVVSRTMKDYLRRLMVLPYVRVEITFYQIAYVSGFIKGPDGYYASATIFQDFKAWDAEGNLVINDRDQKIINIKLEYNFNEYYDEWQWTVLLDDIKVVDLGKS